jgi:hypothetical protein
MPTLTYSNVASLNSQPSLELAWSTIFPHRGSQGSPPSPAPADVHAHARSYTHNAVAGSRQRARAQTHPVRAHTAAFRDTQTQFSVDLKAIVRHPPMTGRGALCGAYFAFSFASNRDTTVFGPDAARTILLFHIISVRPCKQSLMVRTFLKVYGTWLLFFVSARTNKRHHHH